MIGGTEAAAVGFGLAASVSWGTSDFSGGMAAKRVPIFGVMIFSYAVGLALMIALAITRGEPVAAAADLMWATGAGLAGAVGLTAQYRALAVGRMGIAAPVSAVLGATIPVIFSTFVDGVPGGPRVLGFGLAILGVALISRARTARSGTDGLGLAVIAGVGFDAVFWPLAAARGASFAVMVIVALSSGQAWLPSRTGLRIVLLTGTLDVGGNAFFLLAAQGGRLDVASVLSSLYPAVTVILARSILKERITRVQGLGIAAALAAIPLIAA
jgi:drug/metabolite transporter (DMT)-like permease